MGKRLLTEDELARRGARSIMAIRYRKGRA
jgi:hypothetical protein